MSRATLVYIAVILVSAAGLWAIVRAGQGLRAPTDLSGVWVVGGEEPAVPEHLGETVAIEQSGRFVQLTFARGLRVDVKLNDAHHEPAAGENLDLVFEGPRWKLSAFGADADGPLIFRLSGPEKHTFTVTRLDSQAPKKPGGAGAQASALPDAVEASAQPASASVAATGAEDVGVTADAADAP